MNFASDFVLTYSEDEYESLSEEEFAQGMHVSDSSSSGSEEDARGPVQSSSFQGQSPQKKRQLRNVKYHWKQKQKTDKKEDQKGLQDAGSRSRSKKDDKKCVRRKFRRADTNVVSVNFDTLLSPGNMYAGDPVPCTKCSAILSHISKAEGTDQKFWLCEFCGEQVPVDLEPEEIPTTEDVTYLMSPAPSTVSTSMAGLDRSLVVFCVDISGSMCVTSEISGKVQLRGTKHLQRLESFIEGNDNQFLPSQRNRSVTYVSRLQAMQAAVDNQLQQMALQHPDRRVALVAFNNEVTVMGDGNTQEEVVAGDKLNDTEKLREITHNLTLPQAIKMTHQALSEKVYSLEEGGATALGPALVVAVNMAAAHPGSKVILCTDGKANIGLGKLEGDGDKDDRAAEEEALEFYTKTAEEASEKGVTVSVITIQGTDCKLVHLGTMADKTGGQVNIVDCMKLTEEFGNILADPIIATKVKATFLLHKELYVVDDSDLEKENSRAEQNVGNVKKSSTITFEFAKRKSNSEGSRNSVNQKQKKKTKLSQDDQGSSSSQAQEGDGATAARHDAQKELPFQLQIEYTDAEGNKALRVITRKLPVTSDRNVTEQTANLEVLGAHAAKRSADLALQGQYSASRGVALMNQRLAWRKAHSDAAPKTSKIAYKNIFGKIKNMENFVQQRQMMEIQDYGRTRSDSEEDDEEDLQPAAEKSSKSRMRGLKAKFSVKSKKQKQKKVQSERSYHMDDSMARMCYHFRSVGSDEIGAPAPQTSKSSDQPTE